MDYFSVKSLEPRQVWEETMIPLGVEILEGALMMMIDHE